MKIDIKNKKKPSIYIPKLKDIVQDQDGKVAIIYAIAQTYVKVIVLSSFEMEEGAFDHSNVVCQWSNKNLSLFDGSITISN
jgi:hypothetical protein